MHALPLPVAAPLLLLLACTPTGEPDAARDVPAATDRGSTDLEAPTLRPRPPRPPIVGAIVASTSPAADAPRCADRPAPAALSFGAVETRVEQQPDGTLRTVQVPVAAPDIVTLAEPGDLATLAGGGGGSGFGRGGSGLGGRSVRVPTVRQARAEVLGGLDPDLVRRVVRAHIHEVRHCYNNGLARDRNIQGRVSVEFAIDTHGKVSASSVKEDTVPDQTVAPCIAAAARRWRFPKPQSCGPVIVVYPFVLEPG